MIGKEDGTVKLLMYWKKTHTCQYPNFTSHHPLCQTLGVIKTLLDRCNNIVAEPEDREKEVEHITRSLERCGYPSWTITNVKEQQSEKKKNPKKRPHQNTRRILVHPKNKVEDSKKTDCVYQIPCKSERENIWNKTRRTQEGG